MTLDEVVLRFKEKPYLLEVGKGKLSKWFKCSPTTITEARKIIRGEVVTPTKLPKILLFDVETAPMKAFVWGRWNQNINLEATISEWFMLCWSAKWLYSNEVISCKLTAEEAVEENDYRIVKELWKLIDEADIVVAYNGKRADVKWMNTRFIVHKLNPPKPYFIVDPCEVARKAFGFSSNKLDALAGYFNIPHKLGTSFELWKNCVEGDEEALEYMSKYCGKDVTLLEEVYLIMRPWIKGHPNVGNLIDSNIPICSACGSKHLTPIKDKFYYTSVSKYELFRCEDCGAISRGRKNLNKNNKVVGVAR